MKRRSKASAERHLRPELECEFYRSAETTFAGYVFDPGDLTRTFTVDVLIDGHVVRSIISDQFVHELAEKRIGSGCYGFSVSFPKDVVADAFAVEVRLSNLDIKLGSPIQLARTEPCGRTIDGPAQLRWLGGLRFSGWIDGRGESAPSVEVVVDGETISRIQASGWTQAERSAAGERAVRSFDVHLPERFADGRVHRIAVLDESGVSLIGSAIPFVAFADGLAQWLQRFGEVDAERLRGELFDRLMPMSLPLARYEQWRERFPLPSEPVTSGRAAVILVGDGEVTRTLDSLDVQSHNEWVAGSFVAGGRQTCFDAAQVHTFLQSDAEDCDFVLFALSGSVLEADALARFGSAFERFEQAELVYCDLDVLGKDGSRWPMAMPAFDYERLLEQGNCANVFAMRRDAALNGVARGADSLYRMFNSALDEGFQRTRVVHIPSGLAIVTEIDLPAASAVLADATRKHLAARGLAADIVPATGTMFPACRVRRACSRATTTVIIQARNDADLVRRCVNSIRPAAEKASADILILENGSSGPAMLEFLGEAADANVRILNVDGFANFSRICNQAVAAARGDHVCFLDGSLEAADDLWLAEMISRLEEQDVGAVGANLLWPSGIVEHGGIVLGPGFAAQHAFQDRVEGDPGYGDLLRVAHECSAVSAACMLTRRADFVSVGGMDEIHFPSAFSGVDFCLKLRATGRRIIFTPHAKLRQLKTGNRGAEGNPVKKASFERELQALRGRWSDVLADDPYYSPVLSLDPMPYSALAWPPRPRAPRICWLPTAADFPSGL